MKQQGRHAACARCVICKRLKLLKIITGLFVATRVKKTNKKQSQGFDKQIRYTNGNWEAAKGPSRSSSRAATRIAF